MAEVSDVIRASNEFWELMYYDELISTDHYQISYLEGADRPYYNSAHALTNYDDKTLFDIENWFEKRGLNSSIYLDPNSKEDVLLKRGYSEIASEFEKWYFADKNVLKGVRRNFGLKIDENRFQWGKVLHKDSSALYEFLKIDSLANEISPKMVAKLKGNILHKSSDVKVHYCLGFVDGEPATTGAFGISNGMGFIAEAATLPKYQRMGLCTALTSNMINRFNREVNSVFVNCERDAFSNQVLLKIGFLPYFERKFYQQV